MSYLERFFKHLHTVNTHRFLVMKMCFKCGMYSQGLTHDLSKYTPSEFLPSVKYFQGVRSPISKEKEDKGYSEMWLHHKGRNKHHWEYWIDRKPYSIEIAAYPMPFRYMLESVIDKISASKVYNKENYNDTIPHQFFINSKEYRAIHPITSKQIEELLLYLSENGEEKALKHFKSLYKQHKNDTYFNE